MRDWSTEFPTLAHTTYLNSCASGLLPAATEDRIRAWFAEWREAPDWGRWLEDVERARRAFAKLINADPDEVAVQANASSGVSAVASAMAPAGGRKRIVTTDLDFPTAPAIWRAQEARGFEVTNLASMPEAFPMDAYRDTLAEDVALVSVPHVASFTGHKLDVPAIVDAAHAKGARVMVDAFQSLGTTPVDVKAWDVDFLVSGVYKWLLGTAGIAFLYVRRELHDELSPTAFGWYGLEDPYAFDPEGDRAGDARRFQYGGASTIGAVMAEEGLRIIHEVGVPEIARHNQALGDRLLDGAAERGWHAFTPREPAERGSIVTFRVPDADAAFKALTEARVTVNQRLGGLRVSPHFYNRPEDVDRLFEVLDGLKA